MGWGRFHLDPGDDASHVLWCANMSVLAMGCIWVLCVHLSLLCSLLPRPDPLSTPDLMQADGRRVTPVHPADLSSRGAEQTSEGGLFSGH